MKLLLVEDEDHLATALKLNLELEGFDVDLAPTARRARELLLGEPYACIVLDVMLPDSDGFALCAKLREVGNFTPVLMLTARGAAEDRVRGLDAGADDYLVKPFALDELLARVRSLLRRRKWDRSSTAPTRVLAFGEVRIDFDKHEAHVADAPVRFTQLEFDLLKYFSDHAGRVVTREELLENVWKLRNYPNTRTVDNFVARLRKQLEPDPDKPRYFISHRGAGYKFDP